MQHSHAVLQLAIFFRPGLFLLILLLLVKHARLNSTHQLVVLLNLVTVVFNEISVFIDHLLLHDLAFCLLPVLVFIPVLHLVLFNFALLLKTHVVEVVWLVMSVSHQPCNFVSQLLLVVLVHLVLLHIFGLTV